MDTLTTIKVIHDTVSVLKTVSSDFSWVTSLLVPALSAIIAFLVAFWLTDRIVVWRQRKDDSTLGVSIIECLQDEVQRGLTYFREMSQYGTIPRVMFKKYFWTGMQTIPDSVLIRLIKTDKLPILGEYKPKDIRIRCSAWFGTMYDEFEDYLHLIYPEDEISDNNYSDSGEIPLEIADEKFRTRCERNLKHSEKVLEMLVRCKKLLETNALRCRPD